MFFEKKEKLNLSSLRNVFDAQRKILIEKNYPELLNINLADFDKAVEDAWKSLSDKADSLEIKIKGSIPLLLVASRGDVKEKIKKFKGHTGLDLTKLENDCQECLNPFYILLDVEDGTKMLAKSAKDGLKSLEKEKRFPVNFQESISLLTYYPDSLKNHYIITAGTFYKKDNEKLPLLWILDENGNPELHYAWLDIAHGGYGAASCAIKII